MEEEYWRASKLDRENRVGACVAIGTTLVEKFVVRQVVVIKWHSIPWCTHVCKCTVHQALGSITIPAVSARFIVRVSDLHGCELAPCISRSIAGINAIHFSAIFLLLEIQVLPGKRKRMEERSERHEPILIRECARPPNFLKLSRRNGFLVERENYIGRPSMIYRRHF